MEKNEAFKERIDQAPQAMIKRTNEKGQERQETVDVSVHEAA